jgi:hypothetical protein
MDFWLPPKPAIIIPHKEVVKPSAAMLGVGISIWQGLYGGGGGPANAETTTWVNAVVGDGGSVSAGRKTLVDNLITSLKGASVWTKLDRLWLLAAENSQSALRDIAAAAAATATSSPTFTTDRGYAGNGSSSYIKTGFIPSSAGGNYTQNSASYGFWNRTSTTPAGGASPMGVIATQNAYLLPNGGASTLFARINAGFDASLGSTPGTYNGFWSHTRTAAAALAVYLNGVSTFTGTSSSTGLPTEEFYVCCVNAGSATPSSFVTLQFAAVFIGGGLTAQNNTDLYNALQTYMTAVGA